MYHKRQNQEIINAKKKENLMKKTIILLVFLFSINIAQAATIHMESGRNIIVDGESICLNNVNQIIYLDNKTTFFLSNGETMAIPTTIDEYIRIQQLAFATMRPVYNLPYHSIEELNHNTNSQSHDTNNQNQHKNN